MGNARNKEQAKPAPNTSVLRRFYQSNFALVIVPLLLVAVFCFGYVYYRGTRVNANYNSTTSQTNKPAQEQPSSPLNGLPISQTPTLQTTQPTSVTAPPKQTITSTHASSQIVNPVNPGSAAAVPLQSSTGVSANVNQSPTSTPQNNPQADPGNSLNSLLNSIDPGGALHSILPAL